MKLKVCAIYDRRTQSYAQTFNVPHVGQAERAFENIITRPDGNQEFWKYPDDYELHLIAELDNETGEFTNTKATISLGTDIKQKMPSENKF